MPTTSPEGRGTTMRRPHRAETLVPISQCVRLWMAA